MMPRINYVSDAEEASLSTEDQIIYDRVRQRRVRGGHDGLIELDRLLLHAPPIADGWNAFLGSVRTKTTLADDVRELIICRVAALNNAEYEWSHHAPLLRLALVESQPTEQVDLLLAALKMDSISDSPHLEVIRKYAKIVAYVDAMTKWIAVPDDIYENLRGTLAAGRAGDRAMVEITSTCAAYNCVSRFLVALRVGQE